MITVSISKSSKKEKKCRFFLSKFIFNCKYVFFSTGSSTPNGFYSTSEWYKIREEVLFRDNFTCKECGIRMKNGLHVHHVIPRRLGGSDNEDNLIILCNRCHQKHHKVNKVEEDL